MYNFHIANETREIRTIDWRISILKFTILFVLLQRSIDMLS